MHSRRLKIDGETHTLRFGHEGVLYLSSFVMYDERTESKWNHSTGVAMKGPLAGRHLSTLPSRVMRWSDWKQLHPETTVFLGQASGGWSRYRGGERLESFGLSVGMGPKPVLYPYSVLVKTPVVNDTVARQPVLVVMDPRSRETAAYSRSQEGRVLRFEPLRESGDGAPMMRDRATGSVWEAMSGRCVRGPLKGEQLPSVVGVTWDRDNWEAIYPGGSVYRAGDSSGS